MPVGGQDWKPLSSRSSSDSQDGGGDCGSDAGVGNEAITDGLPLFPESQGSQPRDQEIHSIMEELERQLPEIPVQGPSEPQILSPSPLRGQAVNEVGNKNDVAPVIQKPVPTPCRGESTRNVDVETPTASMSEAGTS